MSDEIPDTDLPPSKSQLKREAQALTKLGEQLVALEEKQLHRFSLPENVRDAVLATRKIKQHGARKRQLLFLGKLLRQIDVSEINAQLQSLNTQSLQAAKAFQAIEQWRDNLLADDQALTALSNAYPAIDHQHIRQLIRAARKEQEQNKPPSATRSLFRYLRSVIAE